MQTRRRVYTSRVLADTSVCSSVLQLPRWKLVALIESLVYRARRFTYAGKRVVWKVSVAVSLRPEAFPAARHRSSKGLGAFRCYPLFPHSVPFFLTPCSSLLVTPSSTCLEQTFAAFKTLVAASTWNLVSSSGLQIRVSFSGPGSTKNPREFEGQHGGCWAEKNLLS